MTQSTAPDTGIDQAQLRSAINRQLIGFEYRSKTTLFGLPLVHICRGGFNQPGIAKGVIAVGDIAYGGVAIGGLAVGCVVVGAVGSDWSVSPPLRWG